MVRVRIRVMVQVRFRVQVRFMVRVRVMVQVRVRVRVRFTVRFTVSVRVKVRFKVKLGLGLGSAKVECTMYSESGLVPSPSLFQNHVLTGVTSFEVYVSDVIGRRFEKVKNGHIFENWMQI
jgi:hypothetical protein